MYAQLLYQLESKSTDGFSLNSLCFNATPPDGNSHTSQPKLMLIRRGRRRFRIYATSRCPFARRRLCDVSLSRALGEINKRNSNHKSVGASQLLWCLHLVKHSSDFFGNVLKFKLSSFIHLNSCIWISYLFALGSVGEV